MASSSGTGREYPAELVHGELCRTRFNINAPCDCGKSEPAAESGTHCGHDPAQFVTAGEGTSYCPACAAGLCPGCGRPVSECRTEDVDAFPVSAAVSPAEPRTEEMLRFIDAVSPFVSQVLDWPFPWKEDGQVIVWMTRRRVRRGSGRIGGPP